MHTVVIAILLLGTLAYAIKMSLEGPVYRWLWTVLTALASGLAGTMAANQSKTQIADFLSNPSAMADSAVLITLEVLLTVAYCIASGNIMKQPLNGRWHHAQAALRITVKAFPGFVVFVAVFSLLTWLMFTLTGVSFTLIAWGLAAAIILLVPALAWGIKLAVPERTMRLELLFTVSILMGGLGIVATVNGRTAVQGTTQVEWAQLLTVVGLCLAGMTTGLVVRRLRNKEHYK